ncbi:MAG: ATP-binding protein [Nitrospira sp.]|nr:ATP-binding protein [Nitrospira sp.]
MKHAPPCHGMFYVEDQEVPGLYCLLAIKGSDRSTSIPHKLTLSHPIVHRLAHHQDIIDQFPHSDAETTAESEIPNSIHCDLAIPLINRDRLLAYVLLHFRRCSDTCDCERRALLRVIAQGGATLLGFILREENEGCTQELFGQTERLRSLETLAGGFAHGIRNPLTSIKTFVQLTPERKDDAAFIQEFSQVVLGDIQRIERLINEILDYTRSVEPQFVEDDINEVVSSTLYLLDSKTQGRGIRIQKELASDLPHVMLDQHQIKQVLLNIFFNALDAMGDRGGTLRVQTRAVSRGKGKTSVQIDIEDNGRGIPAAALEHIFDPFYTTKHSSSEHEGAGLGLFLAHRIIREHRGTILVRSTEGVGTTFRITLPSIGRE